jgi:hypothetical protein
MERGFKKKQHSQQGNHSDIEYPTDLCFPLNLVYLLLLSKTIARIGAWLCIVGWIPRILGGQNNRAIYFP